VNFTSSNRREDLDRHVFVQVIAETLEGFIG
jgi:hypothetical protein